jgi:DNA-binding NarL/FixJ family response regulator
VATNTTTTAGVHPDPQAGRRLIRVLLVDDHEGLRRFIADLLEGTDDITVVGECSDGGQVVDAAARTSPDVVLMDLCMPGTDGLEATRRLLAVQPQARVVLLTGSPNWASRQEAQRLGAVGYLLKGDAVDLTARIRLVAGGGTAWH